MHDRSHARPVLAGYDPQRLQSGKVLVVGLGAVGQNLVQNLALIGTGELLLVDREAFERQDRTCSPFYPTSAEAGRFGLGKAAIVAHRAASIGTASDLAVYYFDGLIQVLGTGAIGWADVVVSTVNSPATRAWLADQCRLLGKPLVDGGYIGQEFEVAAYAPDSGAPCYRCGRPDPDGRSDCQSGGPSPQTSAAVLAGYQAEQVSQLLQGSDGGLGCRSDGHVGRQSMRTARLTFDPGCPGVHAPEAVIAAIPEPPELATLSDLVEIVTRHAGGGKITLPEAVVLTAPCSICQADCRVHATGSAWRVYPYCKACGGPWPRIRTSAPRQAASWIQPARHEMTQLDTDEELPPDLGATTASALGLRAGACLIASLRDGRSGLVRIKGDVLALTEQAPPAHSTLLKAGPGLARWILP